jgi:hypothetical protein
LTVRWPAAFVNIVKLVSVAYFGSGILDFGLQSIRNPQSEIRNRQVVRIALRLIY